MAADLRLALVGRAVVGETRVGELRVLHDAKPKLHLLGRQYSLSVIEDAQVVFFPAKARMRLQARAFQLVLSGQPQFGRARLLLRGGAFSVQVPVGARDVLAPKLILHGGTFAVGLSTTLSFASPRLRLRAKRINRVGVAGLIPTIPEFIILTPSPVEAGLLTPTAVEPGLLVPTTERTV